MGTMRRASEPPPPRHDEPHVLERADGFYWMSPATGAEYGPFATRAQALADMEFDSEADEPEPDQTLEETEAEIGLSGWVDPDTGDLGESWTPRLEDH